MSDASKFILRCQELGYKGWATRRYWELRGIAAEFGLTMNHLLSGTEVVELQDADACCLIIYVHTTSSTRNKSLRVRGVGTIPPHLYAPALAMLDDLQIGMKNQYAFRKIAMAGASQ